MSDFITLVASDKPLTQDHIKMVSAICTCTPDLHWLSPQKAVDLRVRSRMSRDHVEALRDKLEPDRVDVFFTASENRRKKIMLADMDSTLVVQETLDEMAAKIGIADKIAPITAATMNGHMDFETALRRRVALLEGMDISIMKDVLAEARLHNGARILTQTMRANGAVCGIASGGFTFFTKAIAQRVGCQMDFGNVLEVKGTKLTGTVSGRIIDAAAKEDILRGMARDAGLDIDLSFAIGDGSNDLKMLSAAALGIGYHPKPILRQTLDNCILYGDLTAALYAQGYKESEFVTS